MTTGPRHRDRMAVRLATAGTLAGLLHVAGVPVASGWMTGAPASNASKRPDAKSLVEAGDNLASPALSPESADLAATDAAVPERWSAGETASLRFTVSNLGGRQAAPRAGSAASVPWWMDAAYLSPDAELDTGDQRLAQADGLARLSAGASYTATLPATLPASTPAGRAYVLLVTDDGGAVDDAQRSNNVVAVAVEILDASAAPPETVLGDAAATPRVTVAWIAHDAFEALRAGPLPSQTVQPVLQSQADPVPDAPLRSGGEPALAAAVSEPSPASPEVAVPIDEPATEPALPAPSAETAETIDATAATPTLTQANEPLPEQPDSTEPTADATHLEAADTPPPSTALAPSAAAAPSDAEPRPSSAPRGVTDADAADLRPVPVFQAGKVEVAEGLTITPSRPDFSVPALVTAIPRNPEVRLTFDVDGRVLDAELLNSAGSGMLDTPIRASLYRWVASGPQLTQWDGPRRFTFTILLTRPKTAAP